MTERVAFEVRFAAAVHAYAGRVSSDLDPVEIAHRIAVREPRRHGLAATLGLRWATVPRVAWVLLLLAALLAAAIGGALFVGSQHRPTLPAVMPPAMYTVSAGTYTAVSVGGDHTCAIRSDGTLECWGHDLSGQATPPGGTYVAVSAGAWHTCAIRTDGTLACWGNDMDDQATPPAGTYVAVSAGAWHTCAIRTDGTLECWGSNEAIAAAPSGTFSAVDAGQQHTCAIRTDGTLACWGFDDGRRVTPPAGSFVSVDDFDQCAVRSDGTLTCWGSDAVRTPTPGTYVATVGGWGTPCAIRADGTLTCWGDAGQAPPAGSYIALSNSLPDYEACAIRTDGKLACWGTDWIAKTDMRGNWMGPPTTLIPDMRGVVTASDVPTIQRGTVGFGAGGSDCRVTMPSTTFALGDSLHFAANLQRDVSALEVVTISLSINGDPVGSDTLGEAATLKLDAPGDCVEGALHWAYAAPPWTDLSAFPISLSTGHYRVTFSVGGNVLSQGEFDVGS